MLRYFKYTLPVLLFVFCSHLNSYSQDTFIQELDKDSVYRYNTSLRILDSLLKNSTTEFKDTSFYNSFTRAKTIDLNGLLFFAIDRNPELKAMQYRIDAERTRAGEFSSLPDPMVEAGADYVSTNFKKVGEIDFYGSQSFPFPGKLRLSKKSALINADMLEQEHHNMETELINNIKKNYYDLYLVNQKLQVNQDNQQIIKTYVSVSEARYSVGKGMQQESFKTQIELSKLMNEEFILRQEKRNLLSELTKLTKFKLDDNTRISFSDINNNILINQDNFSLNDADVNRLVDYAFQYRADLRALQKKILMNKNELDISELERYPDFSLKLGYKILPFEEHNAFTVMAGITVPFAPWSSAKYDYKIQKNEILIKSSEEEYRAKQNEIRDEIQHSIDNLNSAKQSVNFAYNVLIPQTENSLKSTQYNYETNLTNMLDLLDSYKSYQEAKLMYYEAVNIYLKIITELELLTGMNFKTMHKM